MQSIIVDSEFKDLIPPLSKDEYSQLEANILAEGCRDPLVVSDGTLIDGHNRYEICTRHNIPFTTVEKDFPDREAAMDWIDANQLGRRNLSPDAFKLLLGRRYNRVKKAANVGGKGTCKQVLTVDQIDPRLPESPPTKPASTAQTLAKTHGVGEATVKRAAKFAADVAKNPRLKTTSLYARKGWGMQYPSLSLTRAFPTIRFLRGGSYPWPHQERNTARLVHAGRHDSEQP